MKRRQWADRLAEAEELGARLAAAGFEALYSGSPDPWRDKGQGFWLKGVPRANDARSTWHSCAECRAMLEGSLR